MQPSHPGTRARRSRYADAPKPRRRSAFLGLLLLVAVLAAGCGVVRAAGFVHGVLGGTGVSDLQAVAGGAPAPGSIGWKLAHGQRVNLLVLGYGGAENDAPWLTDTMMVVSLDGATKRVAEISVPRDLMIPIDAFASGQPAYQKINVAYSIGMDDADWPGKKPEYTGAEGAAKLAEHVVTTVTGLPIDGYAAVDFKAFRDLVNALGGVQVCLDTPLDDNQYPDYHNGYVKGGIHFPAGCQVVDGERALELARSRHATQPEQASDYGRARRQQLLINAIRKKAVSAGGLVQAPALMSALQKDFHSDLSISDLKALYDWGGKLPDSSTVRVGITELDLVDRFYMRAGSCGAFYADVLCPEDPSFKTLHSYLASVFVDPKAVAEKAPVEVDNASLNTEEMGDRVTSSLKQLGFQMADSVRRKPAQTSAVYDYSGGRYPATTQWLASYFGAEVVSSPPGTGSGLVVVLGRDYALRWIGRG